MNDQVKVNGVQYRLQRRKCGKPGCKCNTPGQEHGPYWYSYDGSSAAKYVGAKVILEDEMPLRAWRENNTELRLHMDCAKLVVIEFSLPEAQYKDHPAFAEGQECFRAGWRRGSNPYSSHGPERFRRAWEAGWDDAWAKRDDQPRAVES